MTNRASFLLPCALILALFLWLGWTGGAANAFDMTVVTRLAAVRHHSPEATKLAIWLTALGGARVTLGLTFVVAAWLWRRRETARAALLLGTVLAGRLAADSIKFAYDRPRPSIDAHPIVTNSWSYPSGHAANSMVAFVALAMFAVPRNWRGPALVVAVLTSIAVSLTRPFLGVHWPSDTLGGWALAAIVLLTARRLSGGGTAASNCSPASSGGQPG